MAKREFKFVGHNVKRVDGVEKVTGAAKFVGDITVPGMLYGKILRSTFPHARIRSIDASQAEALPGVIAVLTAADIADLTPIYNGRPVIAINKVRYVGEPVAAVAAEVRLARFLVHLAAQMESLGRSPRCFVLRMCRRDLASHLGVAHETVSRSFSMLSHWGCIRVRVREVEILDEQRLRAVSRCTRGLVPESAAPSASPNRAPRAARGAQHPGVAGHA